MHATSNVARLQHLFQGLVQHFSFVAWMLLDQGIAGFFTAQAQQCVHWMPMSWPRLS